MGFTDHFDLNEFDSAKLLEYVEKMGENESLSEEKSLQKALILLALCSKKLPEEICRAGRSNLNVKEELVGFRLQKEGNWGGMNSLKINKERPSVCPVLALKSYLQKVEGFPVPEDKQLSESDRLFMSTVDHAPLTQGFQPS